MPSASEGYVAYVPMYPYVLKIALEGKLQIKGQEKTVMLSYNNKIFKSISNADNGEVSSETFFHYWQEGTTVWATYKGGSITFGTLIAKIARDGSLDMRYQHLSEDGQFKTGVCKSTPEILKDGRIRLHEKWQWTSGDRSKGSSIIEEVR